MVLSEVGGVAEIHQKRIKIYREYTFKGRGVRGLGYRIPKKSPCGGTAWRLQQHKDDKGKKVTSQERTGS